MIVPINTIDDPAALSILKMKAIEMPTWKADDEIIVNLLDTANSVETAAGLASNQIWKQVTQPPAAFALHANDNWIVLLNPRIINFGGPRLMHVEECLSLPGQKAAVPRRGRVTLTYLLPGQPKVLHTTTFTDYSAMVVQHEMDHLRGKLIK